MARPTQTPEANVTVRRETQEILDNSKVMLVSKASTWALALILTIFLPRYLGETAFGRLYFAISLTAMFTILVEFGLNSLVTRQVARDPSLAVRHLVSASLIKLALWAVAMILLYGTIAVAGYPADTRIAVYLLGVAIISFSGSELIKAILQALNKMRYIAIVAISEKAVLALLGVPALILGQGFVTIALIMAFSSLLGLVLHVYFLARTTPFNAATLIEEFDASETLTLLRQAIPFFWMLGVGAVYFKVDVVMLSMMTNDDVVGWYGAAYRLFETLNFVPEIFTFAVFPVLCRLAKREDGSLKYTAEKSFNYMLLAGIPISAGTYILADKIIAFLYGSAQFNNSVAVLRILSLIVIFLYCNGVVVRLLIATDRQKKLAITATVAAGLNVGLNLLIIPTYQHVGAAATTLVTEVFVLVLNLNFLPRELLRGLNWSSPAKSLFAALIMTGFLIYLNTAHLTLLILVGALVYVAIIGVTRAISPDDMAALKGTFRRTKRTEAELT